MAAVIDAFPYPWHLPEARELHFVLCQMYPSSKGALFVARQAGLDEGRIFSEQAPYLVWKEILDLGASSKKNRALIERAREQHPENPRRPFLEALLESQMPVLDSEPRGELGAPRFLDGTDEVFEPEALLFRDDLTLPIGRVSWMIGVLKKLQSIAPAVCRFQVSGAAGVQHGTGFRVAPKLLLTNWHVLTFSGAAPLKVTAEFGYDDDGEGGGLQSTAFECDVSTIQTDQADDWGIVQVARPLPRSIPTIRLSDAATPVLNESAFVIQHPGGNRKRIGFVRNQITRINKRVVQYLTDTQTGSSGSPVLDGDGHLIALHHAGGRPQEVAGKPPVSKNEGIAVPAVLKGLAKAGIAVS